MTHTYVEVLDNKYHAIKKEILEYAASNLEYYEEHMNDDEYCFNANCEDDYERMKDKELSIEDAREIFVDFDDNQGSELLHDYEEIEEEFAKAKDNLKMVERFIEDVSKEVEISDIETSRKSISTYLKVEATRENLKKIRGQESFLYSINNDYYQEIEDENTEDFFDEWLIDNQYIVIRLSDHEVGTHYGVFGDMKYSEENITFKF